MSAKHPTATEHFRLGEQLLADSKTYELNTYEAATRAAQATAHFTAAGTLMTLAIANKGVKQQLAQLWQQVWGVFK